MGDCDRADMVGDIRKLIICQQAVPIIISGQSPPGYKASSIVSRLRPTIL